EFRPEDRRRLSAGCAGRPGGGRSLPGSCSMTRPILEVRGLEASYGDIRALHGIDFSVARGGITTILGANGAGKTTTLRAISALVKTRGEVRFDGDRIDGMAT